MDRDGRRSAKRTPDEVANDAAQPPAGAAGRAAGRRIVNFGHRDREVNFMLSAAAGKW